MNPGHQAEGVIRRFVLDYMVSNLFDDDFKLKNTTENTHESPESQVT